MAKQIVIVGAGPAGIEAARTAAKAGAHLKKCCVELGGKDSMIVFDDADLDKAARAANFGSFMHQGQICMSTEKLLIQDRVFDSFMGKFLPRVSRLKTGVTTDPENTIGPLINERQAIRVRGGRNNLIQNNLVGGASDELISISDGAGVAATNHTIS